MGLQELVHVTHSVLVARHTVSTIVKPHLVTNYNHRIYDSGYWLQKQANDIQEHSLVLGNQSWLYDSSVSRKYTLF